MKNIIIGILTLLLVTSSIYAFVQRGFAKEQQKLAVQNALMAEEYSKQAQAAETEARKQHALAAEHMRLAEQAKQECLKKISK